MKKLLITSLFLGSCVLLMAQKTTKIPNVYKPVRSEMYKKGWIDFNKNGVKDTYEDPTAPIDARIEDLLSQMTLEEKTCQMVTLYGYKRVLKDDLPTSEWKNQLWKDGIGAIDEHLNGFQQWGLPPSDNEYVWPASKHAWALNEVQRFFIEETRLGIPTDFTNEGIRGVESYKATNFPTQLGLGHTWNRQLIHQVGLITGREARMLGYTNVYAPILDVGRDQRWGRYEEVYGEEGGRSSGMSDVDIKKLAGEIAGVLKPEIEKLLVKYEVRVDTAETPSSPTPTLASTHDAPQDNTASVPDDEVIIPSQTFNFLKGLNDD